MKKKIIAGGILLIFSAVFAYGQKTIMIDLSKQRLYAMENDTITFSSKISSGKNGHRTVQGQFSVFYKDKSHKSSKYPKRKSGKNGGAKMPHTMMFHKKGYAIHGGYVPNRRASHGCVRMPYKNAAKLFEWAPVGTKIKIASNINIKKYKKEEIIKEAKPKKKDKQVKITAKKKENVKKVSKIKSKLKIVRKPKNEAVLRPAYAGWENPWGK